jgi:hypothetical protein
MACKTAKRLCNKAQGCRLGYAGLRVRRDFNRNAVAPWFDSLSDDATALRLIGFIPFAIPA